MAVFFLVSVTAVFLVAAWVSVLAVFAAGVFYSFAVFLSPFSSLESLFELPEPASWSNDPVSNAMAMLTVDANAAMCAAPKR